MSNVSYFEELSAERKLLQSQGVLPEWFTTLAYQMFKGKYIYDGCTLKDTYMRIANAAAKHMKTEVEFWSTTFFDLMWKGWLAPSTPVLANMGTDRGCPVSCSGAYINDSIDGFYTTRHETAMLTKHGFGTSAYLGDIRHRGSKISKGGTASGVLPVFKMFVQDMRDVAQGTARRGAWAGYIDIEHKDFDELVDYIYNNPDDANIGFNYTDSFIEKMKCKDKEAIRRYQKHMKLRAITGKGYFFFVDKVNRMSPKEYKTLNLKVKASNLCVEITLFSDEDHTFSCVLSSMNAAKFDEWKDTKAVQYATIFLDCVAEEFIQMSKTIPGMDKVRRSTEKGRALGLGVLGFHTYLQMNNIPFESVDAMMVNETIFKHLHDESLFASAWLASVNGSPEWCKNISHLRNTHRTAIAPNTSSALICGSVSQGIEPIISNTFTQATAAGEMTRINPVLVKLMKERGVYNDEVLRDLNINYSGSVQHVDWLNAHEKLVFKTAYEIDQTFIIELASQRQKYICQAQSINLFFDADESEDYISYVHSKAILDPNIKSLYYMRSASGVKASTGVCVACEG